MGEMGTGKTFIGASAAYAAGFQRVLVLTPPHLTRKWKREVEQTVPKARAAIVASITDLERLRLSTGPGPLFAIMSRPREDALSAYENLFGDTADQGAAAPTEEQDANKEIDQDRQGSDVAEGKADGDETGPTEDLKVVVSIREGRATIGVQRPSSDPYIELLDDPDLSGLA